MHPDRSSRNLRRALSAMVACAAAALAAAGLAAAGLVAGGDLRAVAPIALGVAVLAGSGALAGAVRALRAVEARLEALTVRYEEARLEALTDRVTGLWNRRQFDLRLADAVACSLRYREPFSLAVFDLDDFKAINDEHGHAVGDQALVLAAALIRAGTREVDVVCRWGGEEFAVLMQRTAAAEAVVVTERVLAALRVAALELGAGRVRLTASVGIAAFPFDGADGVAVVGAADAALLRAKALGKDRVERASSPAGLPALVDLTGDRMTAPAATGRNARA